MFKIGNPALPDGSPASVEFSIISSLIYARYAQQICLEEGCLDFNIFTKLLMSCTFIIDFE